MAGTPMGFRMQTPDNKVQIVDMQPKGNLPMMKPDDMQYFDKLLVSNEKYLTFARRFVAMVDAQFNKTLENNSNNFDNTFNA